MDYSLTHTISQLDLVPFELCEVDLFDEQVRAAAPLHQPHLQLLPTQDVVVDLPDLHPQHVFRLGHAEPGQAERDSDGAGRAKVAAPVGEEAGPVLRGFEVELVDIEQKLLDLRGREDVVEQRGSLALVLVGHSVAEKRAHCLQPTDASHHL